MDKYSVGYNNLIAKLKEKVHFFKNFEQDDIVWLLSQGELLNLEGSSVLIKENTKSADFYIILKGELLVYSKSSGNKINILRTMESGEIVGEIAALMKIKRTASVETIGHCTVLKYNESILDKIEKDRPRFALKLYKNLVKILAEKYIIPNLKQRKNKNFSK